MSVPPAAPPCPLRFSLRARDRRAVHFDVRFDAPVGLDEKRAGGDSAAAAGDEAASRRAAALAALAGVSGTGGSPLPASSTVPLGEAEGKGGAGGRGGRMPEPAKKRLSAK